MFSPLQILTTTATNSSNIARTKVQAGQDNDYGGRNKVATRVSGERERRKFLFPAPRKAKSLRAHVHARWRDDSDAEATAHTGGLSVPLCDSRSPYYALVSMLFLTDNSL